MPRQAGTNGIFRKLYYSPDQPSGFASARALKTASKQNTTRVRDFLSRQEPYTLHFPLRRKFKRNRVFVTAPDEEWGIDLSDMHSIAAENDGFSFILVVLDAFSKFCFTVPLKNKKSSTVLEGFSYILSQTTRRPLKIIADKGGEWSKLKNFVESQGIQFIYTQNPDIKVSFTERVQLTLKRILFRNFTKNKSYRYYDGLIQKITAAYNNRYHSTIKMAPSQVNETNVLEVYRNSFGYPLRTQQYQKPKAKVGDFCRIAREMGVFEKSVYGGWSHEIYKITKINRHPIPTYNLSTDKGEPIIGSFYPHEIQVILKPQVS